MAPSWLQAESHPIVSQSGAEHLHYFTTVNWGADLIAAVHLQQLVL
jgi:hypothetical protein